VLEVQSFAGRIGRKQEAPFDLVELTERPASFRARQAAVQLQRVEVGQDPSEMLQGVAVLGKHEGGLVCPPEEPLKYVRLALGVRRLAGKRQEAVEPSPLLVRTSQPCDAELSAGLVVIVSRHERQRKLFAIRRRILSEQ